MSETSLKDMILDGFSMASEIYNPDEDVVDQNAIWQGGVWRPLNPATYNPSSAVKARQAAIALIRAGDQDTLEGFVRHVLDDGLADVLPNFDTEGVSISKFFASVDKDLQPNISAEGRQDTAKMLLNMMVMYREIYQKQNLS